MGDWRSGSAAALQAEGHRFKSCIAHHETQNQTSSGFLFAFGEVVQFILMKN